MKPEEAINQIEELMTINDLALVYLPELRGAFELAVEALKEQRPHGEWIEKPWGVVCSRCKAQALHTPNGNQSRSDYCPDCGASMKREGEAE